MAVQIQLRRDTAANWTSVNPVLAEGEQGLELDTGKRKTGNGSDAWTDLPYDAGGTGGAPDAHAASHATGGSDPITPASIGAATAVHTHDDRYYTEAETDGLLSGKLSTSLKGAANGLAELDGAGQVPSSQLPSYVDDVIEAANFAALPGTGEAGKIYVTIDDGKTYRWSGSAYVEISASLALGETSATAYRGDRGKTAYDHSQVSTGNPHGVTKADVGLGNVDNTSDANKPVSTAVQSALNGKADANAPYWVEVVLTAAGADIASGAKVAMMTHMQAGTITGFKIVCDPAAEPSASPVEVDLNSVDLSTGAVTSRLSAVASIATGANVSTGGTISGTQTVAVGDQSSFDIDQGSDGKELRALVQITPS